MTKKIAAVLFAVGMMFLLPVTTSFASGEMTPDNAHCRHHGGCIPVIDFMN